GSHELTITARRLGIPSSTTFDYEFAWLQHQLGCRAATKVVVPDAIPPDRLARYGARPPKLCQYAGLKEEYYLADFEPDRGVLDQLELGGNRMLVVLRPPPAVSPYHRHSNPLSPHAPPHLVAPGRRRPLTDPRALDLAPRERASTDRMRRDPQVLLDLLLSAAAA